MTVLAPILAAVICFADACERHHPPRPAPSPRPMRTAVASWYDDAGATASGRHYRHGFASLLFGSRWGRRVEFCHARRCATGQLDDHGPYVEGRLFDLSWGLKAALGCPDLCVVRYRDWRPAGARLVWR